MDKIISEIEEWRDIKGYERYYQISSHGRVRSMPRYVAMNAKGDLALKKGKILKFLKPSNSNPYLTIGLHKENKRRNYFVHRLVAEAFLPNPENLPWINHKDENKVNNVVSNLEFCTPSYNMNYGSLKTEGNRKKKVLQIDPNTNEIINEFVSIREAGRVTGINSRNINGVCKRENRQIAGGFKWKYKE